MKKAIYFPMNTAHYSSVKSLKIRMKFDHAGYALYVMTLQKLGEAKDRTLLLSEIPALAFDFRCDKDTLQSIIELGFDIDGKNFYSTELNESLAWFDAKHNNCSNGGKAAQAKLTPEEKSERGKKLADLKKQKAQARRDESLGKEVEEQVQAQNFEDNQNSILSKVTLEVDNQDNGLVRTTPLSDTDNRNINRNINRNRDIKEIEIETPPTGLDCVCSQSLASQPSASLASSTHNPKVGIEKVGKESSLLIVEELPRSTVEIKPLPIEPDKRFAEQINIYKSSKYFLPEKLSYVENLYNNYAKKYPNKYMPIMDFEKVLIYLMTETLKMMKIRGINDCILYYNDICSHFKDIPQLRQEMLDNPDEIKELLKKSELKI